MLEAVIAMPDQLFYNTGISTYVWIVTDRKTKERKGKVQLINVTGSDHDDKANPFYIKMLRSLGSKRKEIGDGKDGRPDQISTITKIYGEYSENAYCKIFDNDDFAYRRITIERPLRDEKGKIVLDKDDKPKPDGKLRDYENVPMKEDVEVYFKREVLPHVPDAWIDHEKTKIGYEVTFTKYFYQFKPLRSLTDIRNQIVELEKVTEGMINDVIQ
jgi:type I restriction enzyme M protein